MPFLVLTFGLIGLCLLIGGILYTGRGAIMIAGYNTLPESEKAKYDEPALARFVGKVMFAVAFSMVLWVLGDLLDNGWLYGVGAVLVLGITVFAGAYANGTRFKKGPE